MAQRSRFLPRMATLHQNCYAPSSEVFGHDGCSCLRVVSGGCACVAVVWWPEAWAAVTPACVFCAVLPHCSSMVCWRRACLCACVFCCIPSSGGVVFQHVVAADGIVLLLVGINCATNCASSNRFK